MTCLQIGKPCLFQGIWGGGLPLICPRSGVRSMIDRHDGSSPVTGWSRRLTVTVFLPVIVSSFPDPLMFRCCIGVSAWIVGLDGEDCRRLTYSSFTLRFWKGPRI
jgi:hypothetical protein